MVPRTIHQPSSSILFMFDELLLLKAGGLAYAGPVEGLPSFMEAAKPDGSLVCPQFTNIAEHVLHTLDRSVSVLEYPPEH